MREAREKRRMAGPLRILVVDDDEIQLRALKRQCRNETAFTLVVATNAIDALVMIGSTAPDLVVMDVYMPGLDGVEACRRLKANPTTSEIPIVLASVEMSEELAAVARAAGAKGAISKPFSLKDLLPPKQTRVAVEEPAVMTQTTQTTRGADLLVAMLADAGVDVVFGLPGGAISPVHDAMLGAEMRLITTRHEAGAMFAAAGYAQTSGKLGVVAVTSGPGALNALTGLASAWCDGLPVLLLVGEVSRGAQGKGVLQDGSSHGLQIVEMARHITKLSAEVPSGSSLAPMMRRAIATAMSGRKGPVMLTLPFDVMTGQASRPRTAGSITLGGIVEGEMLDEISVLLNEATRPLLLVGSGVRGNGAPEKLRKVAERLVCPVATTPKAKGVFPEDHDLALGVLGLGGHRSPRAYLESGVDVVVAIGTSLSEMATDGFSSLLQAPTLVHVDIDARQIGKSYSPTHAVVASASDFLGGLYDRIRDHRPRKPRLLPSGVDRHVLQSSAKPNRIASHDAISELQSVLPADTIYTIDSGEHFVFATHYLRITRPDSFIAMTGLGSMGQSIGAAIGAQLAHPDRTVAAICGDGCFAMNAFEIATAVQAGLPIRVFVFNDNRLGMVEKGHNAIFGRTPDFSTGTLDVCSIARGLGATTVRVDGIGQLRDAEDALRNVAGPVIVDVAIDHEVLLPKNGRMAALAKTNARSTLAQDVAAARIPGVVN